MPRRPSRVRALGQHKRNAFEPRNRHFQWDHIKRIKAKILTAPATLRAAACIPHRGFALAVITYKLKVRTRTFHCDSDGQELTITLNNVPNVAVVKRRFTRQRVKHHRGPMRQLSKLTWHSMAFLGVLY